VPSRVVFLSFLFFLLPAGLVAQATQRDVQAVAQLSQAVASMGVLPTDSVATGTVNILAGGSETTGSCRFLARGTTQSAEHLVVGGLDKQITVSNYQAIQKTGDVVQGKSLELATTALSLHFPLVYLSAVLTDKDYNVQSLGQEIVNGKLTNRIRIWKNYSDIANGQRIAPLSGRILWLDLQTSLPVKASWIRRTATGDVPSTRVDVYLNDFRTIDGTTIPFSIREDLNGTPWAKITIQNVSLNTGLSDTDFPTE
jgi:hypothetical protein